MNATSAFLETADHIGNRLCRDAFWASDRCNWIGWSIVPLGGTWTLAKKAQSSSIYDGTAGIALFLAHLHRFTQDPIQKATFEAALNQALSGADRMDDRVKPSFHSGLAGIAFACLEIGSLLGHDRLIQRGVRDLRGLGRIEPNDHAIDVISGSAGFIPVLIDAAHRFECGELVETAVNHGKHLVRLAVESEVGMSWDTANMPGQPNLLGNAHGVSGIIVALLELFKLTGEQEFRETALAGLRYERHFFNAAHGNWPDLRLQDAAARSREPVFMLAWCHGAPGIGLSRLRAWQLLDGDATVLAEAETAIWTTAAALAHPVVPGNGNYCLCHGAGGNAELLLLAAQILGRSELRQQAEAVGRSAIENIQGLNLPWPCGVLGAGETPNLMLGLAGIGYFFLRLHDPTTVPSILITIPDRKTS
jgi:lantibiotic biosynthesis protein